MIGRARLPLLLVFGYLLPYPSPADAGDAGDTDNGADTLGADNADVTGVEAGDTGTPITDDTGVGVAVGAGVTPGAGSGSTPSCATEDAEMSNVCPPVKLASSGVTIWRAGS